jgi:hypothetical protein
MMTSTLDPGLNVAVQERFREPRERVARSTADVVRKREGRTDAGEIDPGGLSHPSPVRDSAGSPETGVNRAETLFKKK